MQRHTRAFTLLEVMIVVGMAAMVMAISIPFVKKTMHRDAVYQAVHVVEDACRNARTMAILNNATTDLVIAPRERTFSVQPGHSSLTMPRRTSASGPSDLAGALADPDVPAPPRRGLTANAPKPFFGTLDESVSIELLDVNFTEMKDEEMAHVRFHPNGTCDEFTIVLRVGSTAWRKISLEVVTAIPRLEIMR